MLQYLSGEASAFTGARSQGYPSDPGYRGGGDGTMDWFTTVTKMLRALASLAAALADLVRAMKE